MTAARLRAAKFEDMTTVIFVKKADMEYVGAAQGQVQSLARLKEVFPRRVLGRVFVMPGGVA